MIEWCGSAHWQGVVMMTREDGLHHQWHTWWCLRSYRRNVPVHGTAVQTHLPVSAHSTNQWVTSFLTAHQHTKGHSVPKTFWQRKQLCSTSKSMYKSVYVCQYNNTSWCQIILNEYKCTKWTRQLCGRKINNDGADDIASSINRR